MQKRLKVGASKGTKTKMTNCRCVLKGLIGPISSVLEEFFGKKSFQNKVVLVGAQFLVVQLVSMVLQLS